jgi:hypothetical protein
VTEQDFLGRPFLVFFGYTHCPDICHTTLFEMSEILRAMGPDAKVGALFVTVDPERDTPESLKDYLSNFDPRIIGVIRRLLICCANIASSKRAPARTGPPTTTPVVLIQKPLLVGSMGDAR